MVDDDIDITNSEEVLWAISSRSDPAESIDILRRTWSGPLDPRIPRDQVGHNSRAVIDATRPYGMARQISECQRPQPRTQGRVAKKWQEFLDRSRVEKMIGAPEDGRSEESI